MNHLLPVITTLHDEIRAAVIDACERQGAEDMASVASDERGDTIYAVDKVSEETLIAHLSAASRKEPVVLVAEGLPNEGIVLPEGAKERDAQWRVLVDPIDGTRGLMYQKRPAWILTGVAPNKGADTRLSDIGLAVQTEIPLVKQHLSDQLTAIRGEGVAPSRYNRITGRSLPVFTIVPSQSTTIAHGFASLSRFFPGARDILASIDDEVMLEIGGIPEEGKAVCFEDQYISTGGQLYELMAGHDRFIADLRPLLAAEFAARGMHTPLCSHPYDLCTVLIAEEMGVIVTDAEGGALNARMDLESDVAWVGYANPALRSLIEPALRRALARRGLGA